MDFNFLLAHTDDQRWATILTNVFVNVCS